MLHRSQSAFRPLREWRSDFNRLPRPLAPVFRPGPLLWRSVAAAVAGARPDQAVAFAVLVGEEVGVDRCCEARVVQLQAQIRPALVRLLAPGGAYLGAAWQNFMPYLIVLLVMTVKPTGLFGEQQIERI